MFGFVGISHANVYDFELGYIQDYEWSYIQDYERGYGYGDKNIEFLQKLPETQLVEFTETKVR